MVAGERGDVLIISKTAVVIGPIEVVGIKQTNKASDAYPPSRVLRMCNVTSTEQ